MLESEIKNKYKLNKMQENSLKYIGKHLIFNAPTGSGKTEGILLSIPENKMVSYLLPTITSSIFMYKRLKKDFPNLNLSIRTSLLDETYIGNSDKTDIDITIHTPDQALIEYLLNGNKTLKDVIVLDEIDNYPQMVKTVLSEYIKEYKNDSQIIVASATLDETLLNVFSDFETIDYKTDLQLDKYSVEVTDNLYDIADFINEILEDKTMNDKKIGVILNSINNMNYFKSYINDNDALLIHHSGFDNETRNINEERLFNKDFKVCISNDIISYSVDIDFDILVMECSDRMATNFQRIGRCNRYNKEIDTSKPNLYILKEMKVPPFIDGYNKYCCEEFFNKNEILTYQKVEQERKQLPIETIPTIKEVKTHINKLIENGNEPILRDVPDTVQFTTKHYVKRYNRKTKTNEDVLEEVTYNLKAPKKDLRNEEVVIYFDVENKKLELKERFTIFNQILGSNSYEMKNKKEVVESKFTFEKDRMVAYYDGFKEFLLNSPKIFNNDIWNDIWNDEKEIFTRITDYLFKFADGEWFFENEHDNLNENTNYLEYKVLKILSNEDFNYDFEDYNAEYLFEEFFGKLINIENLIKTLDLRENYNLTLKELNFDYEKDWLQKEDVTYFEVTEYYDGK